MKPTLVGIDLAKEVFQVHGCDAKGRCVLRKKVRRGQLMAFLSAMDSCTVAMEACSGAHWLARKLLALGHKALLISPQHVKPFVKSNKNDSADAEAICEAASRPSMRFVCVKGAWHLDLQALHRARSCRVARRTALANEIRAIFTEAGVVFAKGIEHVRKLVPKLVEESELTEIAQRLVRDLFSEFIALDAKIAEMTDELERIARQTEACQRLLSVPGIGPIAATAAVAACPNATHFRNGRHFAAWLGLVPRHSGSGGKNQLGGISKRGDSYLRTILIHGARAALRFAAAKKDRRSTWVTGLKERRGYNKASVALANKNARVIWAMLRFETTYKAS
jgi:transposase